MSPLGTRAGSLVWNGVPDEDGIYVAQIYRTMYSSESSSKLHQSATSHEELVTVC